MTAFVRTDQNPIKLRSQVRTPDYLIVQDGTLLHDTSIAAGLKPTGAMIVNSAQDSAAIMEQFGRRTVCLPAGEVAKKEIGLPIPNTVLLAGLLSLTELFPLDALGKALSRRFTGDILEKNLRLIEIAAGLVERGAWRATADA